MIRRLLLSATAAITFATPAMAGDYLVPYVGYFNVARDYDRAAQFGLEYRFNPIDFGIRPTIGGYVTSRGSVYGYGGLNWDVAVTKELYIIPNFMIGAYGKGDGRDLGGVLEFRSGLEIAYQFPNQHRLGLTYNHTSNASIYEHNPGVEVLALTYSIPTDVLFHK